MASFYSGDHVGAVVVDVGSCDTKLGWAGDDAPRGYFRSNAAHQRNPDTGRIRPQLKYDYFHKPIIHDAGGADDNNADGDWEPSVPVDPATGLFYDPAIFAANNNNKNSSNGSNNANEPAAASARKRDVPDWYDLLPHFVRHGYDTALRGSAPSDHPLLLSERAYNPPATRQWTVECLFEELQVPAAFLAKEAVLACYACGRTSATVIDLGYSGTTVVPVYDGYVEPKGVRRNPVGIRSVDQLILRHLDAAYAKQRSHRSSSKQQQQTSKYGSTAPVLYQTRAPNNNQTHQRKESIHAQCRLQLARECREQGAGASINTAPPAAPGAAATAATATFHAPSQPFELPDGTVLDVPSRERFRAGNLLYGDDGESQRAREAACEQARATIAQYVEAATAAAESDEPRGGGSVAADDLAREAVGLSARSSVNSSSNRRGRASSPKKATATRRSAATWQRAGTTHLQALLEEQLTAAPVAQMVCDAAYRCDRDQQVPLLGNVIVSGGGACLGPTEQAVPDTLKDGIEAIIHQHTPAWRVKVLTPAVSERALLPWIGGSILASLGTFHEMWITKAEYEEWGSAIVNRKCP